ncbi:MAG TPA: polysaccharide deacetylase family protein, partial [Burkholderiales bacterium]|nr:polysaccharide deacetylase family protein [Burkholderiales bacterium]
DLKYKPLQERNEIMDSIAQDLNISFPGDIMMTSSQVKKLHDAEMEIGGHTVNHPILSGLENAAARKEMMEGKERLEELTEGRIRIFAYPNGIPGRDYLLGHAEMAKDLGFEAAVSTAKGVSRRGSDLFQLPRFTPWDMDISRFSMRLAANLLQTDFVTAGHP